MQVWRRFKHRGNGSLHVFHDINNTSSACGRGDSHLVIEWGHPLDLTNTSDPLVLAMLEFRCAHCVRLLALGDGPVKASSGGVLHP